MSNTELKVINPETDDNLTGFVLNGIAYLYWLRVYQAWGLSKTHAAEVIKRLTPGIHHLKFTREEFLLFSGTVHDSWTVDMRASTFYFLTDEGLNRAIMEIETGGMSNKDIARAIEERKDRIANIYTRYQKGEVLSLATDRGQVPQIPEKVSVSDALTEQMKRANAMTIVGVDLGKAASVCLAKVEEQFPDEDLGYLRSMLVRQIDGEIGYLTATAIGKEIGATNRTINNILCQAGYQYRTERTKKNGKTEWVYNLTEKGKLFGEVHVGRFGGSERYVILWRSTIIDEIRRVIFSSESQSTLSGVA